MHITHWTWGPAKAGGLLGPGHSHRGTLPESCWPTQSRQEKVLWKGKHHYHILLSWTPDSEKRERAWWGWKPNIHHFRASALVLAFCLLIWGFEAVSFLSGEAELPPRKSIGWAPAGQAPAQLLHQGAAPAKLRSCRSNKLRQEHTTWTSLPLAALFLMYSAPFTCPPLAECLQGSHFQDLSMTWEQLLDFNGSVLREYHWVWLLCFGLRLLVMMI